MILRFFTLSCRLGYNQIVHERWSRGKFNIGLVSSLFVPTIACQVTPRLPENPTPFPTKEKELGPQEGDVVVTSDSSYLIRNGKKYSIPDLSEYKRLTKFEQYGRKIFTGQYDLSMFPPGVNPQKPLIFDPFTGLPETNKQKGGEINVYFPGFLTDDGDPWNPHIPTRDSFVGLRTYLEEKKKWGEKDSLHFTYGKDMLDRYNPKDTAKSLQENIQNALSFFEKLKEEYPLVQFNLIGNSLGALLALEVARKHGDAINNVILFNGPLKGINRNGIHSVAAGILRRALDVGFGIKEKVSEDLYNLWDNEEYKKGVDDFSRQFAASGKGIRSYRADDDPIVPMESSYLPGHTTTLLSESSGFLGVELNPVKILKKHGRTHQDLGIQEDVGERFGENLAA